MTALGLSDAGTPAVIATCVASRLDRVFELLLQSAGGIAGQPPPAAGHNWAMSAAFPYRSRGRGQALTALQRHPPPARCSTNRPSSSSGRSGGLPGGGLRDECQAVSYALARGWAHFEARVWGLAHPALRPAASAVSYAPAGTQLSAGHLWCGGLLVRRKRFSLLLPLGSRQHVVCLGSEGICRWPVH